MDSGDGAVAEREAGGPGRGFTYKNGVMGFGGGLRTRPLRVVDVATGREVESFKLAGDLSSPTDLSFSPDSRLLVAKFVERGAQDASMRSWLSVFESRPAAS